MGESSSSTQELWSRLLKAPSVEAYFSENADACSRDTVLRLAFAFGLDADEAQTLLEIARVSTLHPRIARDAIIAFCLHHHLSLMDAQQMLYDNELPLMGSRAAS